MCESGTPPIASGCYSLKSQTDASQLISMRKRMLAKTVPIAWTGRSHYLGS